MMDLCFYILLYMSILDGYRDCNQKKYIKSEKSPIVSPNEVLPEVSIGADE